MMTFEGQGQNLTSDQGHVVAQVGDVAYKSMPLDETNTLRPFITFTHIFHANEGRKFIEEKVCSNNAHCS